MYFNEKIGTSWSLSFFLSEKLKLSVEYSENTFEGTNGSARLQ